ncbi:MAG: hypothetical protein M3Z27_01855 [Actinomycetota bacterium]|nr:hypothetical protein [Actinomycetota bacterium]
MIVRISSEGQYEVPDAILSELNELDNEAVAACEAGEGQRFRVAFDGLLSLVRGQGRALADDELTESELILPPPDVSLAEARTEFSGEGLIPG